MALSVKSAYTAVVVVAIPPVPGINESMIEKLMPAANLNF